MNEIDLIKNLIDNPELALNKKTILNHLFKDLSY